MRRRTGQATIETTVLVGAAVAALVMLAPYLKRAYQGYLFSGASAHGFQFNPRQDFNVTDRIVAFNQTQDIDIISGTAAVKVIGEGASSTDTMVKDFYGTFTGSGDAGAQIAEGALQGRALATKVRVDTSWDLQRNGRFESQ